MLFADHRAFGVAMKWSIWDPDPPASGVSTIVGGALLALPLLRLGATRLVLTAALATALAIPCALLRPALEVVHAAQPLQLDLGPGLLVVSVLLLCGLLAVALQVQARGRSRRGRRLAALVVAAPGACVLAAVAALLPAVVVLERAERLEARGRRRWAEAEAAWKAGDAAHARSRWRRGCDLFARAARSYEQVTPVYGGQAWAADLTSWSHQAPGWPQYWR